MLHSEACFVFLYQTFISFFTILSLAGQERDRNILFYAASRKIRHIKVAPDGTFSRCRRITCVVQRMKMI